MFFLEPSQNREIAALTKYIMCIFFVVKKGFFCYNFISKGGDLVGYLALYRKYRPTNFSDFVGQMEVARIIKNEILNDKVSHAYLFSGPRGTGKTSTAKIIAKMINCHDINEDGVPCGKCISCLNFDSSSDIVEIDAASNNGVDEIRDLRDKVNLVPTFGKYKVYIIDEVHMLTTQAFNALLKTLEEPPAHIVFILATTEFYKIPVTVVSRCQKFQFLKFSDDDIVERLKYIAECESISVDNDVLFEIARLSDGGMRDAINMLDQLSSYNDDKISLDSVYQLSGVLSYDDFSELLNFIYLNDSNSIVKFVENVDKVGKSFDRFVGDFISFLKDLLVFQSVGFSSVKRYEALFQQFSNKVDYNYLCQMIVSFNDLSIRLKNSSFGKILVISEFIRMSFDNKITIKKSDSRTNNLQLDNNINVEKRENIQKINKSVINFTDKDKLIRINNSFATASKNLKDIFLSKWEIVKGKTVDNNEYFSITSMINDIDAMVVGTGYVIFVAKYSSLIDRLYEQIDLIEQLLFDVFSVKYKCVFLVDDEWKYEKEKYVLSLKSGKKYELLEDKSGDLSVDSDDVDKIVSILGNDIISYE